MLTTQKIVQVDCPGSSGLTPTGPLQFKGDWTGYFIRGDNIDTWIAALNRAAYWCGEKEEYGLEDWLNKQADNLAQTRDEQRV